jgi:DNA-binding MarR family transcriptional regulator
MGTNGPVEVPAQPQSGADFADELGAPLLALFRAYIGAVTPVLDGIPHGPRGYHCLGAVIRGDHPTQLALATWLGIDRTVMTYLLDDLVAAGLVERQLNPSDRRQRKIVATSLGRQLKSELDGRVRKAEDALLQALDDDQRSALRHLLRQAVAGLPGNRGDLTGREC